MKKHNSRWRKLLINIIQKTGILPVFGMAVIAFAIINHNFRSPLNMLNILQQNTVIGIIACGMTLMLIVGGFDLSVGSVAALAGLFGAYGFLKNFYLGLLGAIATGVFIGSINGFFISKVKINPFVTTLGTMIIARGMVLIIGGGYPVSGFPMSYNVIGMGSIAFIPIATLVWVILILISHYVLNHTLFGQYIYAVGGNEKAANLSGINSDFIKFKVFLLGSIFASLAGIILVLRTMSATAYMASAYELKVIAACVVGGCTLGGGKGNILGTVIGVLLMGGIGNVLHILRVSPYWEDAVTGIIIIVAVSVQKLTEKLE